MCFRCFPPFNVPSTNNPRLYEKFHFFTNYVYAIMKGRDKDIVIKIMSRLYSWLSQKGVKQEDELKISSLISKIIRYVIHINKDTGGRLWRCNTSIFGTGGTI